MHSSRFIFILFVGFGLLSCDQKETATENLANLKIAYNIRYDTANDDYEVFIMNADGSGKKNISNWSGVDWVYYAYRDKIYFISDRDTTHRMYFLYEMDTAGQNIRKVSDLRLEDSWMNSRNNGKEMIVAGRIGKEIRYQLFMIDIPSGVYKQLTTDTTAQFADPCFSPDGSQIAFRHRTNRRNFQTEKAELWIMNSDGSGKRQLTHYPESDTTAEWHSYHAGPPIWFEANTISYTSMRQGNYSIFSIAPDGSNIKQLTGNSLSEGWHSWSPLGNFLVFDGTDEVNRNYDIYLMDHDGSEIKKLASDWRTEQGPVFVNP